MKTATGNFEPRPMACKGTVMLRFKQEYSSEIGATPSLGSAGPNSVDPPGIEGAGDTGL